MSTIHEHGNFRVENRRPLSEASGRRSEIELMRGQVSALAKSHGLNADQRIGVCYALKILDERNTELRARRKDGDTYAQCPNCDTKEKP